MLNENTVNQYFYSRKQAWCAERVTLMSIEVCEKAEKNNRYKIPKTDETFTNLQELKLTYIKCDGSIYTVSLESVCTI